jgi:diguanylate cyclase (GGDEF)-like protein/PAS domain S-box-containing protein
MSQRAPGDEARIVATVLQAFEEAGAEFEAVLDLVCRLGCELTGDAWIIRLVDDEGRLRLAGSSAPDVETTADIRSTMMSLAPEYATSRVAALWGQGAPVHLTPEVLEANADTAEPALVALAERRGFDGGMLAPLRVRGRVIGVLWWACGAHGGAHDDDDLRFAATVANRCALAIDNARLLRHIDAERKRHAAILSRVSDAICVVDAAGVINYAAPGGVTWTLGWYEDEVIGMNVFDLVHRNDHELAMAGFMRALGPDDWQPLIIRVRHKNGTWRHLRVSAQDMFDDPVINGVVITGRDVTEAVFAGRLLEEENDILERVATGASLNDTLDAVCRMIDGHVRNGVSTIWIVDDESEMLVPAAGPNAGPLPTLDPHHGRAGVDFAHGLPEHEITVSDVHTGPEWEPWRQSAIESGIAGSWNRAIRDTHERVYGLIITFRGDLRTPTDAEATVIELGSKLAAVAVHRARDADRLAHAASHDTVTNLPNRRLFLERLQQAIARQRRGSRPPSVLFVDLDRFKQVNDRAGHAAGDEVLRLLGERLERVVRPTDIVARFGGDEFAVLCEETGHDEASSVAERLLAAICEPVDLGGRRHHLSASIGIATGRAGVGHDALVRCADVAMYRAKSQGAGGIVAFRAGMSESGRIGLEQDLRRAIDEHEITVHYQPISSLLTSSWIGVEALARWHHAAHGWVGPATFVPLAEDLGLAVPLGELVLEQVCADERSWRDDPALADLLLGINVSGRQLSDPRFMGSVQRLIVDSDVNPARLFVELTETSMMEEYDVARAAMAALRDLGVNLAIDDFGSGHSTLSRLRQFPAAGLKLDRTFIADISVDRRNEDIVAAVVQLAHAIGMVVCAEGVETVEQLEAVRRLGVDMAQGFLLAMPMPAAEVRALVAQPAPV